MSSDFFLQLVLILVAARFLGELVARVKIPAVVGELLAGVLLGPSLLNWIQPTDTITLLAEIGVVLLLFEVGLETDLAKLVRAGLASLSAASAGVVAPLVFGFAISYYFFSLSTLQSLFIGSTLTATSIGITVRVLADLKRQHRHEAQIVLGAAIIDDIIGIILLAFLYEFSASGAVNTSAAGKVLVFITVFLCAAPIFAKLISSVIKYYDELSEIPGLLPSAIVGLLLLFAWLAHQFGAPELLGGFAAGLALSPHFILPLPTYFQTDERFSERVGRQMRPIVHLFTPIFFVNIGLALNLREVAWDSSFVWLSSVFLLIAAVIGKLSAGYVLFGESRLVRWAVGIAMIPRGEVGLIFAEVGKASGVFGQELYATMIIVIVLTTVLAPIALRGFYARLVR